VWQLGVYDRLKNELLDSESDSSSNLLLAVLNSSAQLCLRTYEKEHITPTSYESLLSSLQLSVRVHACCLFGKRVKAAVGAFVMIGVVVCRRNFRCSLLGGVPLALQLSLEQERVFAALFEWRDKVARAEDESVHFILPRRALVSLATNLPVNAEQLMVSWALGGCATLLLSPSPALHTRFLFHRARVLFVCSVCATRCLRLCERALLR
jgi:hypothetical protein